jgi:hypothetical protein
VPIHKVEVGDCFSSIADKYGFFWETLWDDPKNVQIRELRGDPNVLLPGDSVYVPDKREKTEPGETGEVHVFQLQGVPAMLRIQFLDGEGNPRVNVPYTVTVDGKTVSDPGAVTDAKGMVICGISPQARQGTLTLGEGEDKEEFPLQLGHLNPVSTVSGVKRRLYNLGYYEGTIDEQWDDEAKASLMAFQASYGVEPDGELSDGTRELLRGVHDGGH